MQCGLVGTSHKAFRSAVRACIYHQECGSEWQDQVKGLLQKVKMNYKDLHLLNMFQESILESVL